jgi:hypothetical protein
MVLRMAKIKFEFKYVDGKGRSGEGKIEGDLTDAEKLLNNILSQLGTVKIKEKPIGKTLDKKVSLDTSKVPHIHDFWKLSWKERFIELLKWASKHYEKRGLTSEEFMRIIDERFGKKIASTRRMAMYLKKNLVGNPHVSRKKEDKTYRWFYIEGA